MDTVFFSYFDSPIGKIRLRASQYSLIAVDHVNQQNFLEKEWQESDQHQVILSAKQELTDYFNGNLTKFKTPLSPTGTNFQKEVWKSLTKIPFGETRSYQDVANTINNPKAVRAVGLANGKNPISVFIPCHRVIGKNGKLTGYAGGIEVKKILLSIESNKIFNESSC